MPLVSDPGYRLVTLCLRHQIPVVPVPGPSALLAALSASGLPNEEFLFVGFLPARSGERQRALERLRIEDRTIILYEAPHRIAESIAEALEILGDRPACLAREVTKLHEEFRRGKLSALAASLEERPARGEITLLIGPADPADAGAHVDSAQSLSERVEELIRQAKLDRKEALKLAAKERGLTRRAAYDQLLQQKIAEGTPTRYSPGPVAVPRTWMTLPWVEKSDSLRLLAGCESGIFISRSEPTATSKRVTKAAPPRQRFSLEVSSTKVTPRESRPRTVSGRRTAMRRSARGRSVDVDVPAWIMQTPKC
jgi:16S rRNA (cytidine(1402)-2'-O)-methyltransferase